ncbi:hypothetical protein R1sor_022428 [Riccia sorocarpa]|uniref:peptidylprolyl isomerase n=1 Tax=Riccia sorocarpa TaxID=122646 RepID=A0ABD3GJS8_9MARC
MERDYGGASSPPLSDGENNGISAPKLSALFAMEQQKLQSGNSSFRYHPPKLPGLHSMSAKAVSSVTGFTTTTPGSVESAPTVQVLHSVAVLQLLILNSTGGKNFIGNAGMAVLESSSSQSKTYHLVLYDASKKTLLNTSVNHDFQCTPKADCWVDFYTTNQTWSAHFSSTEDWVDFATALILARSLVARISHTFSDVIIQDISPQQDTAQTGLRGGDMVQVAYKAWIERPEFPGTLGHCFQETAGKGKKLELGSGKGIEGLERGLIGMTKSSRRLLLIPPHLAYGSSSERADKIPENAILFFDVTVSRTRRQKGPASEASYSGRDLLLDQLSYNGDAGSEREELISLDSREIRDDLKVAQTLLSREEAAGNAEEEEEEEEDKDHSHEKKELLIDRMAKLSRMGGAGSYNLPPSSVVAHQRRSSTEISQPVSPSSVATTPRTFSTENSQHTSFMLEHSEEPTNEGQVRDEAPAVEAETEPGVKRMEEDELSQSSNQLLEQIKIDDEHLKVGDVVTEAPVEAKQQPEKVEGVLPSTGTEAAGHSTENSSSVYVSRSTEMTDSQTNNDARPESGGTTVPSSSPSLAAPWAQGPTLAYAPFALPAPPGSLPSNPLHVPPYSVITQPPAMGSFPYAPAALPGQNSQPYISHPGFYPWFPWGFPPSGAQPYIAPESKDMTEQLNLLQNIQKVQESLAESVRNLTTKIDALSEVCNKQSASHESELSSGHLRLEYGLGRRGASSQDQLNSEDDDYQVDSLVESVALMLAENKELRRRLSDYKLQSPAGMGPSMLQPFPRVTSNTEGDQGSEVPGIRDQISDLQQSVPKAEPSVMVEPPVMSPKDFQKGGAETSETFEDDIKLVMDQVCREVAEELRQSEDLDDSLPVVHKKFTDGVEAVIQLLQQQKSQLGSPEKRNSNLSSDKTRDSGSGHHKHEAGSATGDNASDIFRLDDDDKSPQAPERPDDSSEVGDLGDLKVLS